MKEDLNLARVGVPTDWVCINEILDAPHQSIRLGNMVCDVPETTIRSFWADLQPWSGTPDPLLLHPPPFSLRSQHARQRKPLDSVRLP